MPNTSQLTPTVVSCFGGLVLNKDIFSMRPGEALQLQNFEPSIEGGYRRINGFSKFGGTSATLPTGSASTIQGIIPYADGVIVCASTNIYFSNDGVNWLQINRSSVATSGDNHTAFTGRSLLSRTNQGQVQFALFEGPNYQYGQLVIADENNKPYSFRMEGSGALASRTFFSEEITVSGTKGVQFITHHDRHLIAAGVEDNLSNNTTSDLAEGTNLYFTNARADARIAAASIDALSDVDITSSAPTNGQALIWNASNSEFEPGTVGSSLTVQDEGSALSTSASILNFVGAGVTASGTGATKTITISNTISIRRN